MENNNKKEVIKIEFKISDDVLFFIAFFGILILHVIPLVKYSLPLGWDSGYYFFELNNLKNGELSKNNIEPLYFILTGTLQRVFGTIPTIKFIQFISIFIMASGTFLFVNKFYDKRTAIIVMVIVTMIPATSRQWGDQYRNILSLSLFPLFLYSVSSVGKKYTFLSGVIFGLIGLTHKLGFVFIGITLGFYTLVKFFRGEKKLFFRCMLIFLIAGLISSPYLIHTLLPSTGKHRSLLLKWEEQFFNFSYVNKMTYSGIFFGFASFLLLSFKKGEKSSAEPNQLLMIMFIFAFLLLTGIFGTPFLIYTRYLMLFCFVSAFFSAPYIHNLFHFLRTNENYKFIIPFLLVGFLLYFLITGWVFLRKMTPFISQTEINAFNWIRSNIPENSVLLIPSREHYWANSITDMEIIPLEWYQLLGQQQPTDEVLIVRGNEIQTNESIQKVKEKYEVENIYLFFTLGSDPILPSDSFQQQVMMKKFESWEQVNSWGNSILFKI